MPEPPDHYRLLGVPRTATTDEVKHAYRELARALHPDRNPDPAATARLRSINAAYEVLGDPGRRQAYDETLPPPAPAGAASWAEGIGRFVGGIVGSAIRQHRPGQDLRYTLELTLAEAGRGCEKEIAFEAETACAECGGQGRRGEAACDACAGRGTVLRLRRYAVTVPPGATTGPLTHVTGAGTPGTGGASAGDLIIAASVQPHPALRPDGRDLRCRVPVPVTLAITGGPLEVPTLDGTTSVDLPPGVKGDRPLRLAGLGLPRPEGGVGDLLVDLDLELPARLTDAMRSLLADLVQASPPDAFPRTAEHHALPYKLRPGP
jgi:molecular chaperone DnaJ